MSDLATILNEDVALFGADQDAQQAEAAEKAAGGDHAQSQSISEIEQTFCGGGAEGVTTHPPTSQRQSVAEIEQMFPSADGGDVATPEVQAVEQQSDAAAASAPTSEHKPDIEPAWAVKARGYNRSHGDHVDQFNQATQNSCVIDGEVSPAHVAGWQEQHDLTSDGKVGPKTVAAATKQAPAQPAAENAAPAPAKVAPAPKTAPAVVQEAANEPAPAQTAAPVEKPKSDAEKKQTDKLLRGQYDGLKKLFIADKLSMADAVAKMVAYDQKLNGGSSSAEGLVLMGMLLAELVKITVLKSSEAAPAASNTPAPTAPSGGGGGAKAPATISGAGGNLKSGSLAKQIAGLNDPQVNAIADQLATLEQMKQEKKYRNQETGEGRDKLVAGFAEIRPKIAALPSTGAYASIKSGFYRAIQNLNAFYEQYGNVDILEGKQQAKNINKSTSIETRTCNITSVSMALESLGKSADNFTGDRSKVMQVMDHWKGRVADAGDSTHKGEGGWSELSGLRLPDFMQLVVIADVMKSGPQDVEEATRKAWGWILSPDYLAYLPTLFGAKGAVDYIGQGADVDAYKAKVLKYVGRDLDGGAGIVVGLSGHYVRLQGFDEDGLVIDDPGGYNKANRKIPWADAREHGYFKSRVVVTG